eukprot:c21951_g1_i1 orf=406-1677(+)
MTRNFHRWEVDPFFSAAEEVQDSADRLESVYRTWIHVKSVTDDISAIEFHRRELSTALGTAKWQLEEFERAVSYVIVDDNDRAGDDAPTRHKHFVDILQNQISSIETALSSSEDCRDLQPHQVVKLGEKEKDDLELFLCGSRRSLHRDDKENDFCISTASKVGKADDVAPSAIVNPLGGKNGMTSRFSTSALNSDVDSGNLKSDVCLWAHELGGSEKLLPDLHEINNGDLSGRRIDEISKPVSDPTSEYFHSDRGENYGEKANGHHRSVSVGSGLNDWKSGSVNDVRSKRRKLLSVPIPSSRLSLWSVLAKTRQPRSWRSGLKRWKDGDANAKDSEMLALMHGVSDIEEGNSTLWFGANANGFSNASGDCASEDSNHRRILGEGFQKWQRLQYTSRPVQIASAILVALGFVGLLSFHVTSSAL